jgi:ADP-ribose pyrophosphatase YjhB (NUDIX family)
MTKPTVFIGSSTKGLEVARAVASHVEEAEVAEVTVWDDGVFELGQTTLEALFGALEQFEVAILVLHQDDLSFVGGEMAWTARDNVLFELGFFLSRLGRHRTFIIKHEKCRVPSDLASVTFASYSDRQDRNVRAAVRTASTRIVDAIRSLPIARHDVIRSVVRGNTERQGKDELLPLATDAKFVAMTYATLGCALSSEGGIKTLPHLLRAQLAVYALPLLYKTHPTLTHSDEIEQEWTEGVRSAIKSLNNVAKCPQLQHLDLVVLSVEPTFTASLLVYRNGNSLEARLRYTPIVAGLRPTSLPTLHLVSPMESPSPLFDQFKTMIDALERERSPMRFPLRRGTTYVRPSLDDFVKRLRHLCSRPTLQVQDRHFKVLLKRQGEPDLHAQTIDQHFIAQLFNASVSRGTASTDFKVEFDFHSSTATICAGSTEGTAVCETRVHHVVGSFALMTANVESRPAVILARVAKPGWTHDVPGGKVSIVDESVADTVERELFEELGLVIDPSRLSAPLAFKYDLKSRRDGVPVIAVYHHYALNRRETDYLLKISGRTTKGHSLAAYPLASLIADQRGSDDSVCHASAWILEAMQRASGL